MLKQISHLIFISFLFTLLFACGGGGGSGGGGTTDTSAPTVSSTSPENLAFDVDRNSTLTATFDEDIFAITVDVASFSLETSDANIVSGTVSFDGSINVASFSPDNELAMLTDYTATLSTVITDLSGNALAENYSWSFSTADGAWKNVELVENNAVPVSNPQIAIDNNGKALAVWMQNDFNVFVNIWANRFDGTAWGDAASIENNEGDAFDPQIAVDRNGSAFAVWEQVGGGGRRSIWLNRFDDANWGGSINLSKSGAGNASNPQIAIESSGSAYVVWQQRDGFTNFNIWSKRFNGTAWGEPELVDANAESATNPQIAVDNRGKGFVVWEQPTRDRRRGIWANRFNGITWDGAVLIGFSSWAASNPQIAVNSSGKAFVVWQQDDTDGSKNVWTNRFDGTSWGSAELIGTGVESASFPQIAVDMNGKAFAVWAQVDGRRYVWANRFDGTDWVGAEKINTNAGAAAYDPQIAIDSSGKALVVWVQLDNRRMSTWGNRFDGIRWGIAERIGGEDAVNASFPQIAVNHIGKALAVWEQVDGDGRRSIWANRFE
jgi:Big-like domain-containing protein